MVEVPHHAVCDRLKRREQAAENAAIVHLRQARVEAGARLQEAKHRSAMGRRGKEVGGAETLRVLAHADERVVRDVAFAVQGGLED